MELKKRLIVENAAQPNAVLINDEGEEYPVFLESLHNTLLFPLLLESGYSLQSLPYGFVKNGVSFDSLPVEEYSVTEVQLEQMYNSIGVKLSYDEIKSHIDVQEVADMNTPPTHYTINTRDELLEYLRATEMASTDDDFMPLNYFVAPEARFSIKEYMDVNNLRYTSAISKRREMSLRKFHKLVAWLRNMNLLGANYSAMDVLDAYFSWGMDGLNFVTVAKHRENRPFRLMPSKTVSAQMVRKTQGFIDGAGNMLTPQNERDVVWKLSSTDPSYIGDLTAGMGVNDTKVVEYKCNTTQEITVLEGSQFNITYSSDMLIMQLQTYPPIRVKSPADIGDFLDLKMALPNHKEELFEYCALVALSRMLYTMRKPRIQVSSYDALHVVGANPCTALNYILTKYDLTRERKVTTEDDMPSIMPWDIDKFLEGKDMDNLEVKSFLEDIVAGMFNIDNIGQGKKLESMVSTATVFNELYAIHNVMGISLEDIYDKIRMIQPEDKTLVFSNGSYQHVVDVSQMKMSVNGYLNDVQAYDIQCADECSFFTFVTMAAREVGADDCTRHVGIEFYMVNRSNKNVSKLLDELVAMYTEKVEVTIADAVQQARNLRLKNVFALSRFFEIALKGTITWSKPLGGASVVATAEQRNIALANLETKIESLPTYCAFTVNSFSSSTLSFNAYCTNAYVTPSYIIPRSATQPIREVPFYTAWMDLAHTNPDTYAQLVSMQVLPPGFVSWSSRYMTEQFKERSWENYDDIDSLQYYFDNAVSEVDSWPRDIVFHSATHPVDYMFPALAPEEATAEVCAPREGVPVVRFGLKRDITLNDYRDKLYPSNEIKEKVQYIRPFAGYSAEAFMLLGSDVLDKMPAESGVGISVMQRSETIFLSDTQEVLSFTRIIDLDTNKYPIINVYGRIWLLRSADGRLWEACI